MKTLLTILILLFFILVQGQTQYGYFIAIETNNKTTIRKTKSLQTLKTIISEYYPKSEIDLKEMFSGTVYFEIGNSNKRFYVEKKKINKRGKYRKLNKKEIRKFRNNE